MLSEGELEQVRRRAVEAEATILRLNAETAIPAGAITRSARDVPRLLDECERLYAQVSACWLLLDEIGRGRWPGEAAAARARALLEYQGVPGPAPTT